MKPTTVIITVVGLVVAGVATFAIVHAISNRKPKGSDNTPPPAPPIAQQTQQGGNLLNVLSQGLHVADDIFGMINHKGQQGATSTNIPATTTPSGNAGLFGMVGFGG